jgi:hypothetical protein
MSKPDHMVLKPLQLVCGSTLEKFGDNTRNNTGILSDSGRSSEDQNVDRTVDSGIRGNWELN